MSTHGSFELGGYKIHVLEHLKIRYVTRSNKFLMISKYNDTFLNELLKDSRKSVIFSNFLLILKENDWTASSLIFYAVGYALWLYKY